MKKNPAECLSIILQPPNLHKQQAERGKGHSPTFTPSWLFPPVESLPESRFHIQSRDTSPTPTHPLASTEGLHNVTNSAWFQVCQGAGTAVWLPFFLWIVECPSVFRSVQTKLKFSDLIAVKEVITGAILPRWSLAAVMEHLRAGRAPGLGIRDLAPVHCTSSWETYMCVWPELHMGPGKARQPQHICGLDERPRWT